MNFSLITTFTPPKFSDLHFNILAQTHWQLETTHYIKERVWAKLQDWKEKLLPQVGREILLKAVIQAIPTFAIKVF